MGVEISPNTVTSFGRTSAIVIILGVRSGDGVFWRCPEVAERRKMRQKGIILFAAASALFPRYATHAFCG